MSKIPPSFGGDVSLLFFNWLRPRPPQVLKSSSLTSLDFLTTLQHVVHCPPRIHVRFFLHLQPLNTLLRSASANSGGYGRLSFSGFRFESWSRSEKPFVDTRGLLFPPPPGIRHGIVPAPPRGASLFRF